jgi:hypothetical protein
MPLLLGLSLICCAPDFDSLGGGTIGGAGGALVAGGGASSGGTASRPAGAGGAAGTAQAGSAANFGGAAGNAATGGAHAGGSTNGGQSGASMVGAAGEAGAGALGPCVFSPSNAIAFDGFDGGFSGEGFALATSTSGVSTVNGSTASTAWDAAVGLTCPGSLRLTGVFKGYTSSTTQSENANGDLRFTAANWTAAVALHAWVKVDPATAPVKDIELFAVSGTNFLYDPVDDGTVFRNGKWNEMVLPLKAGTVFDPTSVIRIGIEIILNPAGTAGDPAVPPTTSAWLDDVWVEQ